METGVCWAEVGICFSLGCLGVVVVEVQVAPVRERMDLQEEDTKWMRTGREKWSMRGRRGMCEGEGECEVYVFITHIVNVAPSKIRSQNPSPCNTHNTHSNLLYPP